jgi:hypothetical protein
VSKEENYVPGFIGLRRLYDEGQYYTVTSIEQNRYDVRVHHADGSVADLFERVDDKRKNELVRRFAGAGLSEGRQS